MDHPSQLLRRVRQHRTRPAPEGNAGAAPAPAPAPVAPAPAQAGAATEPMIEPAVPRAVRRAGSHALYSEVMKRHDRVGTRHL